MQRVGGARAEPPTKALRALLQDVLSERLGYRSATTTSPRRAMLAETGESGTLGRLAALVIRAGEHVVTTADERLLPRYRSERAAAPQTLVSPRS